ncbi:MAG TPA: O-antigen ligase family protein [Candidatus Hydrogenedentes bacterium]|nr:O-antigen ligase family protein [Candidatus Hydrogenedentota bacterium]HPO86697.1 O-antigen ligase family protein [Candidatus Hydrogenedentota bacterium]
MSVLTEAERAVPERYNNLGWAVLVGLVLALGILATGTAALYAVFGLAFFGVFLLYPQFGLYVTTALLLLSGSATVVGDLRMQVPLTAAKVCGAAAFAAWLCRAIVRQEPIRFPTPTVVLFVFLGWAGIGIASSTTWRVQWPEWIRLATLVVYFFFTVNILTTRSRIRAYVVLVLVCGLLLALFALAQYFIKDLHLELPSQEADVGSRAEGAYIERDEAAGMVAVRVSGGTGHSNWLALLILTIMPLNAYWFMTARGRAFRVLALVTVFLEICALVLTFTRTGFLIGCIVLVVLAARNLVRFTPQRVAALALALFFGWFLLPEAYKARVLNFTQYGRSESISNRMELQKAAWETTLENPILGVGLGGYGPHLLQKNSRVARTMRWFVERYDWPPQFIGPHNMYLQLSAETGVVGLGLIAIFFAVLLRNLRYANHELARCGDKDGEALTSSIEVGLIAFLISALFLHALQQKVWWMIAAVAAVATAYLPPDSESTSVRER